MEKPELTWDNIFAQRGKVFTKAHEDLESITTSLKEKGAQRVLDLGSGSGRHVVYLAQKGFTVFGLDASPTGINLTRQWLASEKLAAELQLHDLTRPLPYESDFFDAVFSFQVIHHAVVQTIRKIILEIERVLRQGGFLFVTVPSLKNQGMEFQEIEPNTLVPSDGPEKGLPHHYFTPDELREFFAHFEITDIHLDATCHYCLSGYCRKNSPSRASGAPR